ncbi:MAG: nucleoside triphosphate pyrophosphohydrolase, partial [Alistipes sp.]|nr:nucleoside triphosphate pyrophosphohydrolase [Alistipes sp.]
MLERKKESFARLLEVLDELRVKCPWDREQTMESLRNCTIEETFELTDAIADKDYDGIKQELGDLMLHVAFYSKIAEEEGRFDISGVIDFLCDKLIYRHPHVFGQVDADNPEKVKYNWEQLKLKEKKRKKGILGGVPKSLPAMVKAYRIGEKAASAGFDWEKKEDVWEKVMEEVAETHQEICSGDQARIEEEFGD